MKEMYTFLDKSERRLCLRPEFTSSILRAVLNEKNVQADPKGYYYYGTAYRYERPQFGRYREFHQFGAEIINSDSLIHDAMVIELCWSILQKLQISSPIVLHLNSLGDAESMKNYRQSLLEYFKKYADSLSRESQDRLARGSVLRILDSKQTEDQEIIATSPQISPFLSKTSIERLDRLQEVLKDSSIPYQLDPHLVRGLDYYDNIVFEFKTEGSAIIGGGSYSALAQKLGMQKPLPCIGFSAGIERCLLMSKLEPPTSLSGVGVVTIGDNENTAVQLAGNKICQSLRSAGIKTVQCRGNGSVKKAMKEMDSLQLRYAIIIGESELDALQQSSVNVKDLQERKQNVMSLENLIDLARK